MPPVGRIEHLLEAAAADREVRRDAGGRLRVGFAFADLEAAECLDAIVFDFDRRDRGGRRWSGGEIADEGIDRGAAALDVNPDAVAAVQHPAAQRVFVRQAEHERAEADALDRPPHLNPASNAFHVTCPMAATCPAPPRQSDRARSPAPPDFLDASALDEHRHGGAAAGERCQPFAGVRVRADVVFDERDAVPREVLTELARVRALGGRVQLDHVNYLHCRHASVITW
jgi:hypothetical protein